MNLPSSVEVHRRGRAVGRLPIEHAEQQSDMAPDPIGSWLRPRPETKPGDKSIVEIYRDEHCAGIYIGGIGAARNFAGLNERGIKSVLDVAAGDPRQQAGLELPAVAEHGTAAQALAANTCVDRVEEVWRPRVVCVAIPAFAVAACVHLAWV